MKCIDEEVPFEVPKGWEWCRIRNISQSYIGLTYSPSEVSPQGTIVLRSSNIQDGRIVFDDIVRVTKNISDKLLVEKNDIIICARNGSAKLVGKSAIVTEITEPMTFGAFMAICKTSLYQYVSIFLQSDLFFSQLRGVSGTTTINQLTQNNFNGFLIAIPPLEEQHRIFEKINDVLPIVEIYGNKQEQLNKLNDNLRENVKKSILQEAIQGRLVQQIAEESTAQELLKQIKAEKQKLVKEGKLKKSALNDSVIFRGDDNKYYEQIGKKCVNITEEIPFEIPASWTWCHLNDIAESDLGKTMNKGLNAGELVPYLCSINVYWNKIDLSKIKHAQFTEIELAKYLLQKNDLLICEGGDIGRAAIWDINETMYYQNALHRVHFYGKIFPKFFLYILSLYKALGLLDKKSKGMTIKHFTKSALNSIVIPLPPLLEQKRIIEKIEQLMQLLK